MRKTIKKFSWFIKNEIATYSTGNEAIDFILKLNTLQIGILSYTEDKTWIFSYSEEFKKQKEILPLVNFPTVDKEYISDELWPFFVSRIPSKAQRQLSKDTENPEITTLLKTYGRRTIANPYQLIPAF